MYDEKIVNNIIDDIEKMQNKYKNYDMAECKFLIDILEYMKNDIIKSKKIRSENGKLYN